MKSIFLTLAFALLLAPPVSAQEKATTESGKKIVVFPDGTWKPEASAAVNAGELSRPSGASAKAAINRGKSAIYYNPKKWKPEGNEESGKTSFEHVEGDGYAIVITERLEATLESLKSIALTNAKNAAPDAEIISEEKKRVNGKEVLALKLKGTISGISFLYYGYYYSGKEGTIQVITYTAQNLFDEFKPDFEEFLNGLAVTP